MNLDLNPLKIKINNLQLSLMSTEDEIPFATTEVVNKLKSALDVVYLLMSKSTVHHEYVMSQFSFISVLDSMPALEAIYKEFEKMDSWGRHTLPGFAWDYLEAAKHCIIHAMSIVYMAMATAAITNRPVFTQEEELPVEDQTPPPSKKKTGKSQKK
jgi:hypothetical protein